MLIIRGVNIFPSQIEELVLKMPKLAPHYQLMVSREGRLDKLTVNVERRPAATEADDGPLIGELQHHIKSYIGLSTQIIISAPGTVERSQGKARRVIDNRDKG